MAFSEDLISQQFGNYRLVSRLGVGGFASVYLGQHIRLPAKQAAIKILNLHNVDEQQFQQEAETTERLVHPNIVRLLDFDVQQGIPFLVLDYAPGGSLRARHPKGNQVPLATVIEYLKEIVPALQHAHDQHILHRDIKPDNILIGRQGELLLSDFGIALLSQTGHSSQQGPTSPGGTAAYMAPEQFRGRQEKASDQYALGIVVYEWLSGTVPFSAGNWIQLGFQHLQEPVPPLRASVPTLSTTIEAVIMKALAKQPQDRFSSVQTFAQALEAAYQQPVIPPPTPSQHLAQPEVHQLIQDETTEPAKGRGSFSPVPVLSTPPLPSKTDQQRLTETPATRQSSSSSNVATEAPTSPVLSKLRTVSFPVRRKQILNRRILFILVLVLLIALSGGSLYYFRFLVMTPTPQIMFGFDAAHTHYNPNENTLNPGNISQLKPLWSFLTVDSIKSSPAVAGGMVYVGSLDNKLYAFDTSCRHTCLPLWSFATGGPIFSSPAVANGMVYVGSGDHKLYAFDASCRNACQPLWSFTTGGSIDSSPAVAGGMLYVGSNDDNLYAFDASCRNSCKPLWSFTTGSDINSSPAVAGGMVYVGSLDGKLYAFDASCRNSCKPLWSFSTGNSIYASPEIAGSIVYVGSFDGKLYVFDTSCHNSCKPLWSLSTENPIYSSPAVANGIIYFGSYDHNLYAFGLAT